MYIVHIYITYVCMCMHVKCTKLYINIYTHTHIVLKIIYDKCYVRGQVYFIAIIIITTVMWFTILLY